MQEPTGLDQETDPVIIKPHVNRSRSGKEVPDVLRIQTLQIACQPFFHLLAHVGKRIPLHGQIKLQAVADIVIAFWAGIATKQGWVSFHIAKIYHKLEENTNVPSRGW